MKVVHRRCAGVDVHKKSLHVTVRIRRAGDKKATKESAVFGTYTEDLERLREWLRKRRVRRVVLESTGVFWIPVWNVLERGEWKFSLLLVNPQHVHALPGRKTDQKDSERLAELAQYDLLRGSFVPPAPVRQLRDLTRKRATLQGDRNRTINRIGRLLETANYKLGSAVSSITGKTGMLILRAIAKGVSSPERLAELAQGSLKNKKEELTEALKGKPTPHFRWLLADALEQLDHLDSRLAKTDIQIRQQMEPHRELIARLCTIPGVQEVTAWTLIAELGTDTSVFPTPGHAASWAGLCPGECESGGKRYSGRTRKGNRYLRRMLVQCAWSVTHRDNCPLASLFHRVAGKRGMKKAAVAVAHRILVIAFCMMRDGTRYRSTDPRDIERQQKAAQRLVKRLDRLARRITKDRAPATPEECGQCARWGIACIHARNSIPRNQATP